MLSRINVFSSLVVIQTAESTKHKLSLHIICATVRHLGTKLPMHLCKRYVGYHWSDFRWLIVFLESEEVRKNRVRTSAENVCFSHRGFFAMHQFYIMGKKLDCLEALQQLNGFHTWHRIVL